MTRLTTLQKKPRGQARHASKQATKQARHASKQATKQARRAARTVSPAAADARDAAIKYADATRDWAAPKIESAVDWAAPKVDTAKEWAAPKVETAKEWTAPKVEPAVEKVQSDVIPAVAGAVASALAASEPVRTEAAKRGSAALAALKGEVTPPKQRKHRLRKLLLLGGVVGVAYAGWKAWVARGKDPVDAWTSGPSTRGARTSGATTSSSFPGDPTGNVSAVGSDLVSDDPGGAGPDEAIADEADESAGQSGLGEAPTTESVSPAQAKKVSRAASKSTTKSTKPKDSPTSS